MTPLHAYLAEFNGEVFVGNMVIIAASKEDAYALAVTQFPEFDIVEKNTDFSLDDITEIDLTTPHVLMTWAGVI